MADNRSNIVHQGCLDASAITDIITATNGLATTDKIGFYGVTPIVQRTSSSQTAVTTATAISSSAWGFTSSQANAIVLLVNELRDAMVQLGFIKGS